MSRYLLEKRKLAIHASVNAGKIQNTWEILRKITVQVQERDLALAQAYTGEGVTDTVRAALKKLASLRAQQELRKLRGTFQFTIDLDELREDRNDSGRHVDFDRSYQGTSDKDVERLDP